MLPTMMARTYGRSRRPLRPDRHRSRSSSSKAITVPRVHREPGFVRAGKPPTALTQHNSKAYFNLSSRLTGCRKRSLRAALDIPKLRRRFARFLEDEGDSRFLSCRSSCCAMRSAASRPSADALVVRALLRSHRARQRTRWTASSDSSGEARQEHCDHRKRRSFRRRRLH